MTIECYYGKCPHHGSKEGHEGPFCFEDECKATVDQIKKWGKERRKVLEELYGRIAEKKQNKRNC